MASGELVAPAPGRRREQPCRVRRLAVVLASALALAACAAVAVQRSGRPAGLATAQLSFGDAAFHGALPAVAREGSVRGSIAPKYTPPGGKVDEYGLKGKHRTELAQISAKEQALAFGDAKVVKGAGAAAREGSVRNGVKPDFEKPIGDLGEVGLAKKAAGGVKPSAMQGKMQALAFGDAKVVKGAGAAGREGSVRNGVKPDFEKPIGDLGEVGLAKKAAGGVKPSAMQGKMQVLAFGDAKVVKGAGAAGREGSVRNGVKPDFVKPLGNLGQTGLAAKPLKQQQLAFGDASFHSSAPASAREGSVRGNIKPDFSKPIGDLGETGLAAAKGGKKLSDSAARNAMKEYYAQQAKALKASRAPELTAKAATAQLSSYFSKMAEKDAREHAAQLARAISDEKSQKGTVATYYTKLQTKDAKLHAAAVAAQHKQDAAVKPATAPKQATQGKTAVKAPKALALQKARAQQLTDTPLEARLSKMQFGEDELGNKVGHACAGVRRAPCVPDTHARVHIPLGNLFMFTYGCKIRKVVSRPRGTGSVGPGAQGQ